MSEPYRLTALALLGAMLPTLLLIVLTLRATGGTWEYALDDVYIHLAMSDGVARGEYGVNAGEAASASSSILYSYLLAPFSGTALHVLWPLALGLAGLIAAALLWARVLVQAAGLAGDGPVWLLPLMAVVGPVLMHFPAMAVIGMEHMLHITATLAVLSGLVTLATGGGIGWLLVAGLVLNPLLRFEGMAVLLLGCAAILLMGRPRPALAILAVALVPLGAHFAYMSFLGLDMLPNSVNAKAAVVGGTSLAEADQIPGRLQGMLRAWELALISPSGRLLLGGSALGALGLLALRRRSARPLLVIGWMAVILMLAHVTLGSTLPFYRYEVYAWSFAVGAAVTLLVAAPLPARQALHAAFAAAFVYSGLHFVYFGFVVAPQGSAAIYAQQRQMGRFVDDFWKAPVAVNDLGHVVYDNPYYVLDLWGLANAGALEARLRGDDPLWADKLAARYGVKVAMIYDHWLGQHIGPDWVEVAELKLTIPQGTLGGPVVSFYATDADAVAPLRAALEKFAPTLPASAELDFKDKG